MASNTNEVFLSNPVSNVLAKLLCNGKCNPCLDKIHKCTILGIGKWCREIQIFLFKMLKWFISVKMDHMLRWKSWEMDGNLNGCAPAALVLVDEYSNNFSPVYLTESYKLNQP